MRKSPDELLYKFWSAFPDTLMTEYGSLFIHVRLLVVFARVNCNSSLTHQPLTLWMLGNFLKIDYVVVCFFVKKPLNSACFLLGIIDWVANRLDPGQQIHNHNAVPSRALWSASALLAHGTLGVIGLRQGDDIK